MSRPLIEAQKIAASNRGIHIFKVRLAARLYHHENNQLSPLRDPRQENIAVHLSKLILRRRRGQELRSLVVQRWSLEDLCPRLNGYCRGDVQRVVMHLQVADETRLCPALAELNLQTHGRVDIQGLDKIFGRLDLVE